LALQLLLLLAVAAVLGLLETVQTAALVVEEEGLRGLLVELVFLGKDLLAVMA
jgi:hypothetical protein